MKIGMLGGSFCPPTIAHLELSQKCIEMGYCDKVVWVPVNDAYRKSTNIPSQYRVDMVKLTLQNQENITCSLHELEYDRIIRTLESIKVLQARCPDDKIVFIAGADKMGMKWFQQEEFVRDFGFIVTNRGDIDCEKIIALSPTLSKWQNNIQILNFDSGVSSTQARDDILKNGTTTLVTPDVMKYIAERKLFC